MEFENHQMTEKYLLAFNLLLEKSKTSFDVFL
jgi:hypothetical protein